MSGREYKTKTFPSTKIMSSKLVFIGPRCRYILGTSLCNLGLYVARWIWRVENYFLGYRFETRQTRLNPFSFFGFSPRIFLYREGVEKDPKCRFFTTQISPKHLRTRFYSKQIYPCPILSSSRRPMRWYTQPQMQRPLCLSAES